MNSFTSDLQALVENVTAHMIAPPERLEELRLQTQAKVDLVRQAGVQSYEDFFALIANDEAGTESRIAACDLVSDFARPSRWHYASRVESIDRRRALPPLLAALKNPDDSLRKAALWSIGLLGNKRAFKPLVKIALEDPNLEIRNYAVQALALLHDERSVEPLYTLAINRGMEISTRIYAVYALGCLYDKRTIPLLLSLMTNRNEDVLVRAEAAEQIAHVADTSVLPAYIDALNEDAVEMRFWAAFGIVTLAGKGDIPPALEILDRVVAYDDAVLPEWWSVGREAAPALASLWHNPNLVCDLEGGCGCGQGRTLLISPMPEYWDYRQETIQFINDKPEHVPLSWQTSLRIEPDWLGEQLRQQWPDVRLDQRQPKLQSFLLTWEIDMPDGLLSGSLHRDGYGIFLTGDEDDIQVFAHWYRGIISPEHTLRLYQWADVGEIIS